MRKITKKEVDALIQFQDFCIVINDKLAGDGLPMGTKVFVAGTKAVPIDESDLYNVRMKIIVAPLDDAGHAVTKTFYIVDPKSLKKVSKRDSRKYTKILEKDFGNKPETKKDTK